MLCEGGRTEVDYLNALKQEYTAHNVSFDLQVDYDSAGSVPFTLVKHAVRARGRFPPEASEIDEVWCIFDVEWPQNHPNLDKAMTLAKNSGIKTAVSNPCFELWLVLHFQDQTAWLDTQEAVRLRRNCDGSKDKGLDGETYMPLRAEAVRRALYLEKRHIGNDTKFPKDNPSSSMHQLLNAIDQAV